MSDDERGRTPPSSLRQRAGAALQDREASCDCSPASDDAGEALLQELRLHQVELEMQNEELRRNRIELERARDRYFQLYDRAPIGYVTLDGEGFIRQANLAACTLLGRNRQQILGRRLSAFLTPDAAGPFHLHRRAVLSTSTKQVCELGFRSQDGGTRLFRLESIQAPSSDDTGLVCRTALIDITEQHEANRIIHEQEARLRAILDTAIDGIITFDGSGDIESFNRAAGEIFGYESTEIVGKNVYNLLAPGSRAAYAHGLGDALGSDSAVRGGGVREIEGMRRDGTVFPMEISIGTMRDPRTAFTVIVRDISTRKRLEEEFRHAQKMEAIGRLASGVAHDFNNLLMGVSGAAEMALSRLAPDSPARPLIEEITRSAVGGAAIVRQLLTFGRKSQRVDTGACIDSVVTTSQDMLRRFVPRDIELRIQLGAPGLVVNVEPMQIQQVLMNLVVNACDAMPEGGVIVLATEAQVLAEGEAPMHDALPAGRYVRLAVRDTGGGMDAQTRSRAFEPFFTTKGPGLGTGLGMWTIFDIIRQGAGRIDIASELGQGTTVTILLPCTDSAAADVQPEPVVAEDRSEVLLLVEDDELVRRTIRHYLEEGGYRVLEASNEPEALAQQGQHEGRLDALVTDIVLSQGSGPSVARKLAALQPGLCTVFVSAHSEDMLVSSGRLEPGSVLLQKPFTRAQLLSCVRAILDARGRQEVRAPDAARRITILVVEDHEMTREVLEELLQVKGYAVLAAASGAEAIRLSAQHPEIALALTDMSLPDMDGPRLVEEMRTRIPGLVVLYTSGLAPDDPAVQAALGVSGTAFIGKPVELSRLLGLIHSILSAPTPPR